MMKLEKRYQPQKWEPKLQQRWREEGTYHFDDSGRQPVYSVDTPPPTVSGHLHLGHASSYTQADFIARYRRMRGFNVFYPMGYDDNGLPTERLVERWEGIRADDVGRDAFVERCLAVSEKAEAEYRALWQRLALSVDWRHTYRTIDKRSQQIAQWSFLDLYRKGLTYRQQAPAIWCPECQTAIAQAELDDLERQGRFYTLAFQLENGDTLPIATTRPELLPACVAVFLHPDDRRAARLVGQQVTVPATGQRVPILADREADPEKGTGAVMCCTFGDTTDIAWWRTHELELIEAIGRDGRLLGPTGKYAGLTVNEARRAILSELSEAGLLLAEETVPQTVRVHERCDTPVEYVITGQWFIRVMDFKETFLEIGETINWHPEQMQARYHQWVENLAWDWCISRERAFGVPFPLWHCADCGEVILAQLDDLPVDPRDQPPDRPCPGCGSHSYRPETDVMDTWATSSLSPQIVGGFQPGSAEQPECYRERFPFALRPQAHEIIRTWAFYTIVKNHHHFGARPWQEIAISGWALAPDGASKISKSRGGGPIAPLAMIERHSADAVRYWAASTRLGKDSIIDERKIEAGARLVTKLWNVARFAGRFIEGTEQHLPQHLTVADRWLLSRTQRLVERATSLFDSYDYAGSKSETEQYFWQLADNYLEMAKKRLYDGGVEAAGARFTLSQALLATIKLLAPILPHVTDAVYQGLFARDHSIHNSRWPEMDEQLLDTAAERAGDTLVEIATAVRRYKSEAGLSLSKDLARLHLVTADGELAALLREAEPDLASITRAVRITVGTDRATGLERVDSGEGVVAVFLVP